MPYFIISNCDGDTEVEVVSETELLKRIDPEEEYYGEVGFLDKIEDNDTNYWGDNILIIKGKIVVPKPKDVVVKYVIDE